MERVQSLTVPTSGGVGQSEGCGWKSIRRGFAVAACAAAVVGGMGCVTAHKMGSSFKSALGIGSVAPATQLTAAFQPQIQYLPDPTQDTSRRPGLVGQMFLIAANGQYTDVDGDLTVMAEDVTLRPPGSPKAISEVWHFDKNTLRRLKTKDERFGDTYALFLPYPPNWTDVTQISISCKYEPKPEAGAPAGPVLNNSPQVLTLDYSTPGKPVWTETANGGKRTAPAEMKAIPDVGKAIAQGRTGAATNGPQPALNPAAQNATATTPQLPPPTYFDGTKPVHTATGPNGSQVSTTAFALPPGQTLPPGWTMNQNRELVPPPGANPWSVTPPPMNAVAPQTTNHAAPPAVHSNGMPATGYPPAAAPTTFAPPTAPPTAFIPPSGNMNIPVPGPTGMAPMGSVAPPPGTVPSGGFDPNSPVGPWANTPTAPGMSAPLPQIPLPAGGSNTVTIPRR